jgi:hypothetical protein
MSIRIPEGAVEGQMISVQGPNGSNILFKVPTGAKPGSLVMIPIPSVPPHSVKTPHAQIQVDVTEQDLVGVGSFFFLLSVLEKSDKELPFFEVNAKNSEMGWKYFQSLTDASGNMNLQIFQKVFRNLIAGFLNSQSSQIANFVSEFIQGFVDPEQDISRTVQTATQKVITKILDSALVFSAAIFQLFGNLLSLSVLHNLNMILINRSGWEWLDFQG